MMFAEPSRRELLRSAALAPFVRSAAPRANILWIIAEDFCPDLGCYGNPLVHSPNLDRLAQTGVRFENAFVTAPVCSASRSALATGMYQTSIGAHHHRSHRDDGYRLPDGVQVFTHYLREAGYHTSNVRDPELAGTGKTDLNFAVDRLFDGDHWTQRGANQPFYSQINFQETHRAFHRFSERPIDPARVTLPPCYPDHPATRLDWALYLDAAQRLDVKVGRVLERLEREGLRENTILIFFGDNGQPMPRGKQFLYEGGIRVPLVVHLPEAFRVPGYRPGTVSRELVSSIDITATTLRLAGIPLPSQMQGRPLFGGGVRKRDYIFAARDRCDETVDRIRCVRDRRYKYIRNYFPDRPYTQPNNYKDLQYPPLRVMRDLHQQGRLSGTAARFMGPSRPSEELYDLQADPFELRNLAGEATHRATLGRLGKALDRWIRETGDRGETPEPQLPAAERGKRQAEGWLASAGRLEQGPAGWRIAAGAEGKAELARSVVVPGGKLRLEVRLRSGELRPVRLAWATIEDMRSGRSHAPVQRAGAGLSGTVEFTSEGWLGSVSLQFQGSGAAELEFIRLSRLEDSGPATIQEWLFA